jgi:hypothetical protein
LARRGTEQDQQCHHGNLSRHLRSSCTRRQSEQCLQWARAVRWWRGEEVTSDEWWGELPARTCTYSPRREQRQHPAVGRMCVVCWPVEFFSSKFSENMGSTAQRLTSTRFNMLLVNVVGISLAWT